MRTIKELITSNSDKFIIKTESIIPFEIRDYFLQITKENMFDAFSVIYPEKCCLSDKEINSFIMEGFTEDQINIIAALRDMVVAKEIMHISNELEKYPESFYLIVKDDINDVINSMIDEFVSFSHVITKRLN